MMTAGADKKNPFEKKNLFKFVFKIPDVLYLIASEKKN